MQKVMDANIQEQLAAEAREWAPQDKEDEKFQKKQ